MECGETTGGGGPCWKSGPECCLGCDFQGKDQQSTCHPQSSESCMRMKEGVGKWIEASIFSFASRGLLLLPWDKYRSH